MKIRFLGTAAAEGIPAPFCKCAACAEARKRGGRYVRTRSQALIDKTVLLDFNQDTYMHTLQNMDVDFSAIPFCFVTHTHLDHLYPGEICMRVEPFAHHDGPEKLAFYGSAPVGTNIMRVLGPEPSFASFTEMKAFDTVCVGGYTVTALPARHDPNSGPLFYAVEKDGAAILYAHDTGYFFDEVWDRFAKEKKRFDIVSIDCTEGARPMGYDTHSNLECDTEMRGRMIREGFATEKTAFVLNHFSHNGAHVGYDDLVKLAMPLGFTVSYDGLELDTEDMK